MKYFLILCLILDCGARELPSYINVCKSKHTDITKCILKNVEEQIKPRLLNGVPEMGIPTNNPFFVKSIEVSFGKTLRTKISNIKIWGLAEMIIDNLIFDLDNVLLDINMTIPDMRTKFEYNVEGKVLLLNLDSTGPGQINITNLFSIITTNGTKETRHGKSYYVFKNINLDAKVGNMSVQLENLFPGNPDITENANKLFNDNQLALIEEFAPIIYNVVKNVLLNGLNNIFTKFPIEVLFPDD
ncbi:protein takeout-like [Diabrotica virgifera virgifera]|uniref:Protein takeout-like n=1 Tax=Diabrotica virgifera virgifera TaxID=50390 RepID=A0ABM5KNK1_DIAVI|nr:protein takeout-like [Diabrotica virgifera virgifera]